VLRSRAFWREDSEVVREGCDVAWEWVRAERRAGLERISSRSCLLLLLLDWIHDNLN
jgi:hypothetical protein